MLKVDKFKNTDYTMDVYVFNDPSIKLIKLLELNNKLLFCKTETHEEDDGVCNSKICVYKRYIRDNNMETMSCRIARGGDNVWICGRDRHMSSVIELSSLISVSYFKSYVRNNL